MRAPGESARGQDLSGRVLEPPGRGAVQRAAPEGPREPERLPIQLIEPNEGKVVWLLEAPAAGMHDDE